MLLGIVLTLGLGLHAAHAGFLDLFAKKVDTTCKLNELRETGGPYTDAAGCRYPWQIGKIPTTDADATYLQRRFVPHIYAEVGTCYPYSAVDADGNINSGFPPSWSRDRGEADLSEGCQYVTDNAQIYARSYTAETNLDPTNDWCATMYAFMLPTRSRFTDFDEWDWHTVTVFLKGCNHPETATATRWCYDLQNCYAKPFTYRTPEGADVAKVLYKKLPDSKTNDFGITAEVWTLDDKGHKVAYDEIAGVRPAVIDWQKLPALARKAFDVPAFRDHCTVHDDHFVDSLFFSFAWNELLPDPKIN